MNQHNHPTWWRLSYPPANHQWFPGAWYLWWPIYRRWMLYKSRFRRWLMKFTHEERSLWQQEVMNVQRKELMRANSDARVHKSEEAALLIEARSIARAAQDWTASDEYRDRLVELDIEVKDTREVSQYYWRGVFVGGTSILNGPKRER